MQANRVKSPTRLFLMRIDKIFSVYRDAERLNIKNITVIDTETGNRCYVIVLTGNFCS